MSVMGIGDFTVWNDLETMTTTVSVDGRTEQVTQTVGEMLEILGRYTTRLQDENDKLREALVTFKRYYEGEIGKCDLCDWQGMCENHPAPPQCKHLDDDAIDDWLRELGVEA